MQQTFLDDWNIYNKRMYTILQRESGKITAYPELISHIWRLITITRAFVSRCFYASRMSFTERV